MKTVKTDVHNIIKEVLQINPKQINPDTPWYELGVESFDLVDLIVELRDHFKIAITTKDLAKINTLNDLIRYLEHKSRKK